MLVAAIVVGGNEPECRIDAVIAARSSLRPPAFSRRGYCVALRVEPRLQDVDKCSGVCEAG
jgi:hypothetical protein